MVDKVPARTLGPALARAWIGYHRRVQTKLAEAGFADQNFPDGPILRLCRDPDVTVTQLGRDLGITRQGASKLVTSLRERGYVTLEPSPADGREKFVQPTAQARARVAAAVRARREVDEEIRDQLGDDAFEAIRALAELLTDPTALPLREMWRERNYGGRRAGLSDLD